MPDSVLTPQHVEDVFVDCLFKDEELPPDKTPEDIVKVEGIVNQYGFHPGRLHGHADEIMAMLLELPDNFMKSKGGGWSFLNACMDKHGNQWTGLHQMMENLFCLGMGIGKVECVLPRSLWGALPGGVPYYLVLDND